MIGGLVYVVGGFNGSQRENTVVVYDVVKDQWTDACSMNAKRSTLGVAILQEYIYAVGGFDGTSGIFLILTQYQTRFPNHITNTMNKLHYLPVESRIQYKVLVLMHACVNRDAALSE